MSNSVINDPLIEIILEEFEGRKSKNSAYSMRAFALFLEVDPSNLSKLLKGQILPQNKLRKRLADKLGLQSQQIYSIKDKKYSSLGLEMKNIIKNPFHFEILECLKLKDSRPNINWISKKLKKSYNQVSLATSKLINYGLLKKDNNGHLISALPASSSIIKVDTSKAHREQQKNILGKAINALDEVSISRRSQSSMTFAIDSSKLDQAKEQIKHFRRNMEQFLTESDSLDEVYHLSIALFPVTDFHLEGK